MKEKGHKTGKGQCIVEGFIITIDQVRTCLEHIFNENQQDYNP